MERRAIQDLEQWLYSDRRKPLIVWGARQVGKTYLIKEIFAKKHFNNKTVYIDFRKETKINEYCTNTVDPKEIMEYISLEKNVKIDKNTLLIFDEIQECLPIITSLKYFNQDYSEYTVIATGSMVRTKLQRIIRKRALKGNNSFLFPVGKINQITLYPMTFDEFLINYNKNLYNHIVEKYVSREPLEKEIHEMALDILFKYLLVGGMPEAVEAFLDNENYYDSRKVLKDLYDNYLSDMELYQASSESIVRSRKIFESIFLELNKENKNFKCSLIEKESRTRDMINPIEWLNMANIVHKSALVKESVSIPLIDSSESLFRLYLGDIGMFSYQSGINSASFVSNEGKNSLSGIFFENYVANEFVARGLKLFYWKGKNDSEFEFIVESNNTLYPIDVKKGKGMLNSLEKYKNHNKCNIAIKISNNNYGYDSVKKILTIPLYSTFLLAKDLAEGNDLI